MKVENLNIMGKGEAFHGLLFEYVSETELFVDIELFFIVQMNCRELKFGQNNSMQNQLQYATYSSLLVIPLRPELK